MRSNRPFSIFLGLALGLVYSVNAQPGSNANGAEPLSIDLSRFQNQKFVTDGETNTLWQSLVGRQVYDGLPFLIEGRACLYGKRMGPEKQGDTPTYPDLIGILVGRKFEELHLLHFSQWAEVEGRDIATIRLNYADGTKQEFPILFGGHVRDWQRMASEEKELLTDPNTKIIWRGPGMHSLSSTMRLFKTMLANPHPEKVVTTMDVVSAKRFASYTLVAATVANKDITRPVTPPCPSGEPERHFEGALTIRVTEQGSGRPIAGAQVQPGMDVDGAGVIANPFLTSATGEGVLPYPLGRVTRITVSVQKEGYGFYNTFVELEPGPTNRVEVELRPPLKVTGVVRDRAGAALAGVELTIWPQFAVSSKEATTDADGRFALTWTSQNVNNQGYEAFLVARDLKQNLALAQAVEENTTNLDLRLEPGLTLAGRALDPQGKAVTNAQAQLMFWSERMSTPFGKPVSVDDQGKFEIKALPAGRRYGVNVSAKGHGRVSRNMDQEAEGRRIELEPCELAVADRRIAGVVLDADDKPVADATVQGNGEGQPQLSGRTDSKGRFSFNQVCAGPISLFANDSSGIGFGNVTVEGGDTNITVQFGVQGNMGLSGATAKVTGLVTDTEGKPAAKVSVSLFPMYGPGHKLTDGQGRFSLTYNPKQYSSPGSGGGAQPTVVARDLARNLAAALELEEGATNASVRLEPGLAIAGRVSDSNGKAIANAQAQVMFHLERMSSSLGMPVRANAEGRFEIKGLPPGRRYSVSVSAKGFGQEQREVAESDSATNRIELDAVQLVRADQRVAGVVLDADDKPVAHASVYGHGERQPAVNGNTDAKGRFTFTVCPGPIQLSANAPRGGYGSVNAEGGETNVTIQLGTSGGVPVSSSSVKIGGLVTDPEGKPAPKVRVSMFPSHSSGEKQTDSGGRFTLMFDPRQFGGREGSQPVLVARDLARNLAAAVDLEEGATNASVRLEPALTLAGLVHDPGGKGISNAQASALFFARGMGTTLGSPAHANAEGRFEIKGLPPGRNYTVITSAKGFGQEQRKVPESDMVTNRVELEPFELMVADQLIAGVVLDVNDKPVAHAYVNCYGQKQPNFNAQTDAKGRFTMDKVCAGTIQLSANNQQGGYANVKAEAGDTNVVIRMSSAVVYRQIAPPAVRLKGKPLPDLAPLGLTPEQAPAEQPLLAVLIDAEQRPSRRTLRLLGEQAAAMKEKGVAVIVVHAGTMTEDAFKAWKQEAALAFPVGCVKGDAEKARAAWGASALPWLILTDKAHHVTAEGFALEELDAKLKSQAK